MKKTTKKALFGTLFAVLVISAPFAAEARPYGHGGPGYYGGGYQAIPPEKQQAFDTLRREHFDKIQPIREQIWAKQTTLDALSANAKTEPKDITNLVNEISALRNQLFAEKKAFADRVKKETGLDLPYGMGPGGKYYGHKERRGYGHGGHGRGCAW
ncbi:periplasmic heavy metal sensor [Desulfovibrio sp. OttesenSCG-928-O18]|nr:periplasmic heavy metal sensor [Desulfovibrio sp. OttesenSCG-928-O18]